MGTRTVACPDDLCSNLARARYEQMMWCTALDRLVDRNLDNPDAVDSPMFRRIAGRVAESIAEEDLIRNLISDQISEAFGGSVRTWDLDVITGRITVEVFDRGGDGR